MKASMKLHAPIRRRKLYEEVVVRLEAMIHEGELNPGDLLPSERELMLHFGVGRPAIREALFALHRMGLVIVANGERPRVSSPTPKTMLGELAGAARLMLSKPEGMRSFQQGPAACSNARSPKRPRASPHRRIWRRWRRRSPPSGGDRRRCAIHPDRCRLPSGHRDDSPQPDLSGAA
jgi:Transcriptional regulators